jgi:hypothetical protein
MQVLQDKYPGFETSIRLIKTANPNFKVDEVLTTLQEHVGIAVEIEDLPLAQSTITQFFSNTELVEDDVCAALSFNLL